MYRVQFIMQHQTTKQKLESNEVYYDELDEFTITLLTAERTRLELTMPYWRILYLIERIE